MHREEWCALEEEQRDEFMKKMVVKHPNPPLLSLGWQTRYRDMSEEEKALERKRAKQQEQLRYLDLMERAKREK